MHPAHLAQFVSGVRLHSGRADFHVCGTLNSLDDNVFMMTNNERDILGTLLPRHQAGGNRGGLRLLIFGNLAGLEWDMEAAE